MNKLFLVSITSVAPSQTNDSYEPILFLVNQKYTYGKTNDTWNKLLLWDGYLMDGYIKEIEREFLVSKWTS